MARLQKGLRSEIQFWRDLIANSRVSIHSHEFKRLERALYSAQMKLLDNSLPTESGHRPVSRL